MRFVITGPSRTGTMFLAQVLARSRRYIVRHEHADDSRGWFEPQIAAYKRERHLELTRRRFDCRADYGEVNSFLRYIVTDLELDKRAVLIRNPFDIALSYMNKSPLRWGWKRPFEDAVSELVASLDQTHHLISEKRLPCFRFERYTRSLDELAKVVDWLGIDDIDLEEVRMTKVNSAGRDLLTRFSALHPAHRREIRRLSAFAEIYYPEEAMP